MMYGTPGGIVLIFGGDVRYLNLAMRSPVPNEIRVEIPPVQDEKMTRENSPLRPPTILLSDPVARVVPPASVRSDVSRRRSKTGPSRRKWRGCPDERRKP